MSIKFKVISKGQPGVAGGGTKKWYATSIFLGEVDLEQLTKSIEQISTVNGADIRAVLYALVDVIPTNLANNQIVRIGELGSLRLNVSSEGKNTEKEVTASTIRNTKLIFTPGKKLKEIGLTAKFEKM